MDERQRCRFIVSDEEAGERIDSYLALKLCEGAPSVFTRSYIQKLVLCGDASIDGEAAKKNARLRAGQVVEIKAEPPRALAAQPQDIPIAVVYEDDSLIVVDKPKGMVVHPAPGNPDGTLVNALLYHCGGSLSGINGVLRPGIVHRIDKDTSGLLVVAKNDAAHLSLSQQIAAHTVTRRYQAVVHGALREAQGTVDASIGRSEKDRKKYCVTEKNAKSAVTHYQLIENYERFAHVELRLETGRTHQIRVHMASIGHPVAGDTVYGPKDTPKSLGGQCLHAGVLGFVHPETGEYMEFHSELPRYFTDFLKKL
ncbi:MAG: RluA family pseudouridine synthase [Oscillospiraceae bacterium]|nr:RluA family pseudouridine synthase [Oscillospiraceae bacterium]